jgi:hypothetical protein
MGGEVPLGLVDAAGEPLLSRASTKVPDGYTVAIHGVSADNVRRLAGGMGR